MTASRSFGGPRAALVAVDVDGTLFDDDMRVSEANREAIRACAEAGVLVVLATGRMHRSAARVAAEAGIEGPVISYNGALVRAETETLLRRPLDRETALDMLALARKRGVFSLAFVDDRVYSEKPGHLHNDYYHRHSGVEVETVGDLGRVLGLGVVMKLLFIAELGEMAGLEADLRASRFVSRCRITGSMSDMLEVTDAEADKGIALTALARRLGIEASRVAAIGDNDNDLGMFASAPISIAMGNASDRVKAAARYETAGNNEDGVAVALRRFALGEDA